MFMPPAAGYRYIVQARCTLSAWPEWRALRTETGQTLNAFLFEEILRRWGVVDEIVTDNGTAYVAALDWLASRYGIRYIRISAYNSRVNGIGSTGPFAIHWSRHARATPLSGPHFLP